MNFREFLLEGTKSINIVLSDGSPFTETEIGTVWKQSNEYGGLDKLPIMIKEVYSEKNNNLVIVPDYDVPLPSRIIEQIRKKVSKRLGRNLKIV